MIALAIVRFGGVIVLFYVLYLCCVYLIVGLVINNVAWVFFGCAVLCCLCWFVGLLLLWLVGLLFRLGLCVVVLGECVVCRFALRVVG